jgi:hypothetical protein
MNSIVICLCPYKNNGLNLNAFVFDLASWLILLVND